MAAETTLTSTSAHTQATTAPAEEHPPHPSRRVDPAAVMAAVIGDPGAVHACLELTIEPRAARQARRFAVDKLHEWGCAALAESAELICSELATNAVLHGRTKPPGQEETIHLVLSLRPGAALVIQIADNSPASPVPRASGPDAETGRGLCLVSRLADAWTSWPNTDGTGKKVGVYLRCPSTATAA